jgi:hypothetical protein
MIIIFFLFHHLIYFLIIELHDFFRLGTSSLMTGVVSLKSQHIFLKAL